MNVSTSTLLKLAALFCFYVGIDRLAHGKTMADSVAIGLGCLAVAGGVALVTIAFRLERKNRP